MLQLAEPVSAEIEVKKSRFIGQVFPVANRDEARVIVAGLRAAHPGACHVCSALITEGDSGLDDDGEPSGTAAKPMYSVMTHKGLMNVLAVVVRYWGGCKLGAGGLTRAYGQAISEALREAHMVPVENYCEFGASVDFADEAALRRLAEQHGAAVLDAQYGEAVTVQLKLKAAALDGFKEQLTNMLRGRVKFSKEE